MLSDVISLHLVINFSSVFLCCLKVIPEGSRSSLMPMVERASRPKVSPQQLQGSSTPKPSGDEHLSDSVTAASVDLNQEMRVQI